MTGCSVILCGPSEPSRAQRQLLAIHDAMRDRQQGYEVLLVGDSCKRDTMASDTISMFPEPRWIKPPRAGAPLVELLKAGLAASSSEQIVFLPNGNHEVCRYLPALLARLARADFVQGKRRRHGLHKLANRFARIPQWLLLGLDLRDPGCQFWAARRETLVDIPLRGELLRYLGLLVAQNGFRVDEIAVPYAIFESDVENVPARSGNLIAAWKEKQRLRHELAESVNNNESTDQASAPATIPFPVERRKSA